MHYLLVFKSGGTLQTPIDTFVRVMVGDTLSKCVNPRLVQPGDRFTLYDEAPFDPCEIESIALVMDEQAAQ